MIWNLNEILELEIVKPGSIFGQYDIVCKKCNCDFVVQATEDDEEEAACPNCGIINEI